MYYQTYVVLSIQIIAIFGVDRTKITRRVKDFEKIKNEPEVMELYEKIVQNDIIK